MPAARRSSRTCRASVSLSNTPSTLRRVMAGLLYARHVRTLTDGARIRSTDPRHGNCQTSGGTALRPCMIHTTGTSKAALSALFLLALLYTLYFARAVILPV